MDLATVTQALDALYQRAPHLPRRPDLAQTVLDAYPEDLPENAWHLTGVVAALWPIGAAAGAERGHALTVGAIRGELAQALADPSPDARGRWVVMGMAKAADDLPAAPDPSQRPGVAGPLIGDPRRLDQALTIGLGNSWVAGHRAASDAAIGRFAADVDDLVGHERIATTFLTPSLTAEMLLDEIAYAAYRAAEADREHPAARQDRHQPTQPQARGARPTASRAFVALRRLDPHRRIGTGPTARPSTGPGRPGPGR